MYIKHLREKQYHDLNDTIIKTIKYTIVFKTRPYRIIREYYLYDDPYSLSVDRYSRKYYKWEKKPDLIYVHKNCPEKTADSLM